ncbi:hypothetical protein QFZ98_004289, partial [Paraburkholderia youngii]
MLPVVSIDGSTPATGVKPVGVNEESPRACCGHSVDASVTR